jgi:hypothetical protein
MPARIACVLTLVLAAGASAQQPATVVPIPPLVPAEVAGLPVGTDVSRPLTAVQATTPIPSSSTVTPPADLQKATETPPPQYDIGVWDSSDFLLWWYKGQTIPPLVTGARTGSPTLDNPNSVLLVGGKPLATGTDGGARFVYGSGIGEALIGYEAVYTFLGGNTGRFNSTDPAYRGYVVGLPFQNPTTGVEHAYKVSGPAGPTGYVDVATSTRVSSWEVNGVGKLYDGPNAGIILLAGYRYFRLKDGLRVETAVGRPTGLVDNTADQFDTQNQFHGGQIGFKADLKSGAVFVEVQGKVALGQNNERVDIGGRTNVYSGGTLVAAAPGGFYAVASNSGRYPSGTFAVLPEAILKVGFQTSENSRFSIGYNFLYLNNAVRPGDQVDRVVNTAQVPARSAAALMGLPPAVDRPGVPFGRTDFWVQGLVFSWDSRY